MEADRDFWQALKEQQLDFFNTEEPLWRLSLASDIETDTLHELAIDDHINEDAILYEWGGALRWLKTDIVNETIQKTLEKSGGHASLFRDKKSNPGRTSSIFQPLSPGLSHIHKKIKLAFDPKNILNPGKQYPDL